MRGVNLVTISGNVTADINFASLPGGEDAVSFMIVSDRRSEGVKVSAKVKINVYIEQLIGICKPRLVRGIYVIVVGELMNRDGNHGKLTEVRAREIIFL